MSTLGLRSHLLQPEKKNSQFGNYKFKNLKQ
jgi:hypothetical protein